MARPKGSRDSKPRSRRGSGASQAQGTRPIPVSNGSVDSNHNQLSDEEKTILLIQGVKEIEQLLEKQHEITANIRNARKRLKSDGFATEVVNYALYLRKTDPEQALEQHRQQLRIAKWLAHPIGSQASFDLDQPVDRAFDEGKAAGLAGLNQESSYHPGSPEGQRWIDGWNSGQETLMAHIQKKQDEDDMEGIPDFLRTEEVGNLGEEDPLGDVPL